MVMIPDSVEDWFKDLRRQESRELTPDEQRMLLDMMKIPAVREVWRRLVEQIDARADSLKTVNVMDPEQAAAALRTQGEARAIVVLAERYWSAAREG